MGERLPEIVFGPSLRCVRNYTAARGAGAWRDRLKRRQTGAAVNRCVVFDADANEAHIRAKLAMKAVGVLRRRGIEIDEVVSVTTRSEVERLAVGGESVLLLDMTEAPYGGNVGARIARAVASRPEAAARTRRIVWTRHNWTTVLQGLDGYAQAIVRYDPEDGRVDGLVEAIEYACAQPADGDFETRAFPPAQDPEIRRTHLRQALCDSIGTVLDGDLEIAEALRHRIPNVRINAMLEDVPPPRRKDVQAFLKAFVDHGSATSLDDARGRVYRKRVMPWTERSVDDELSPEVIETAAAQLKFVDEGDLADFAREHWLLVDEVHLCRQFVQAYEREAGGAWGGVNGDARWRAVRRALEDSVYRDVCASTGLGASDLAYALHSIRDRVIDG